MRVFVTSRALTKGIEEREVLGTFVSGLVNDLAWSGVYYREDEWHHDRASAVTRAEQMRLKKLASLRKQIAKLEALSFEEKTSG